jgi:hypothetical protein
LCNSHVVTVPLGCEGIAVVDEAISAPNVDFVSADEVGWTIELFFLK